MLIHSINHPLEIDINVNDNNDQVLQLPSKTHILFTTEQLIKLRWTTFSPNITINCNHNNLLTNSNQHSQLIPDRYYLLTLTICASNWQKPLPESWHGLVSRAFPNPTECHTHYSRVFSTTYGLTTPPHAAMSLMCLSISRRSKTYPR